LYDTKKKENKSREREEGGSTEGGERNTKKNHQKRWKVCKK